jgi:hypothetical protein
MLLVLFGFHNGEDVEIVVGDRHGEIRKSVCNKFFF